jgi:hypothetical protein
MGSITGGSVSFTRTTRPADFESKSATVTLTFDDKDMLDSAASLAQGKALELVGLKVSSSQTVPAKEPSKAQQERDKKKAAAAAKMNDADKNAPKGGEASDLDDLSEKPQISSGEERKDPAQADADDDLLGGGEEKKEVTDKDLTDAVQKYIAGAGETGPKKVKELRATFVEAPKGLRDIPQEQRKDFLDKLSKLK